MVVFSFWRGRAVLFLSLLVRCFCGQRRGVVVVPHGTLALSAVPLHVLDWIAVAVCFAL